MLEYSSVPSKTCHYTQTIFQTTHVENVEVTTHQIIS